MDGKGLLQQSQACSVLCCSQLILDFATAKKPTLRSCASPICQTPSFLLLSSLGGLHRVKQRLVGMLWVLTAPGMVLSYECEAAASYAHDLEPGFTGCKFSGKLACCAR